MSKAAYERETAGQPQYDEPEQNRPGKLTIAAVIVLLIAAAAITLSELHGGALPTWDELASMAKITEPSASYSRCLAVHFIDVGQGDSILVQAPTGETMLIDAGERGNERTVTRYVRKYGDGTLEYVVATHPHSDHIGSMDDVIRAFKVSNVLMPRLSKENTPTHAFYKDMLRAIRQSGAKTIAAKPGFSFPFGKGTATVLSPAGQTDELNDMSVVLRLDWGGTSFLFTGDAETAAEQQILCGRYAEYLDVDVLKVGHHGSGTSSCTAFLSAVSPQYAVISCGAGNDYGHPHEQTLERLGQLGTTVLRTDTMGSIRMYTDGDTIFTETENG